ncbi:hypothetical protein F5X68DRAFT_250986, partial [Plectosphaerella plurivora]
MEHFIERNRSHTSFEDVSFMFDTDKKVPLDLRLPSPDPEPRPQYTVHVEDARPPRRDTILERCRPISFFLSAWAGSVVFTVVYCLFIYHILIVGDPQIGSWTFDASLTNLLLSILSQLYAMLLIFFQLSPATDWLSVFKFIYGSKFRSLWGLLSRLSLPFMGLGFGSILKFQNTFEYHFIVQGPTVDVYAGNIPPDISIIKQIPASYMAGYHDTWAQGLQNYPRYTFPWQVDGCDDNCTAFFLPGGMEIARKIGKTMDAGQTLLHGGLFNNVESVSIERAPGLAAEFKMLGDDFLFKLSECTTYVSPREVSDGVQFCLRQVGESVAVDMANLTAKTLMTVYRQHATTMYARADLAIKHIEATSPPVRVHTSANDTQQIWDRIFVPDDNADMTDRQSINITIHRLAWKYRTYVEFFPDHNAPVELLSNFMAVPLQFAVTAMQYANSTGNLPEDKQGFPSELITTATGGRSIQKFVSPPWTAWTFIVSAIGVVLVTGAGFLWVLTREHPVPRPSGITELDFATKLANGQSMGTERGGEEGALPDLLKDLKTQDAYTAWTIVRHLRGHRLELTPEVRADGTVDAVHFPVLRM